MGNFTIKVAVDICGHLMPEENRQAANRISDKVLESGGTECEQDANSGEAEAVESA